MCELYVPRFILVFMKVNLKFQDEPGKINYVFSHLFNKQAADSLRERTEKRANYHYNARHLRHLSQEFQSCPCSDMAVKQCHEFT